jgi:hypothetical protein
VESYVRSAVDSSVGYPHGKAELRSSVTTWNISLSVLPVRIILDFFQVVWLHRACSVEAEHYVLGLLLQLGCRGLHARGSHALGHGWG